MKKYFIKFIKGFENTYSLVWAETPEQIETAKINGYERITRRTAEVYCSLEKDRRKYNSSFSGYSSNIIKSIDEVDYII